MTPAIPPTIPPPSSRAVPTSSVLTRIEKELSALWSTPAEAGEAPKTRVCTMNLIVVAPSRDIADKYTTVIDEVTASNPARAIVVALEPDAAASGLEGDVSAVCSLEGLCSERVRLVATGSVSGRVGSAVLALTVAEMPTALVWLGRLHVDDPVFVSLAREASRIVLDTEFTSLSSLVKLARWCSAGAGRPPMADLAWTRLAPWQELCARFFDGPNLAAHVNRITRLVLKQAGLPGERLGSEGTLLLAWMATRLGWKTSRVAGALRFKRPDGGYVAVELGTVPRPPEVAPAAVAFVGIDAEAGGVVAHGTIERDLASGLEGQTADADVLVWKLNVALPSATEQRVRLGANKAAGNLERTLHRPAHDPALAESVAFAEQIFEDGLACG